MKVKPTSTKTITPTIRIIFQKNLIMMAVNSKYPNRIQNVSGDITTLLGCDCLLLFKSK